MNNPGTCTREFKLEAVRLLERGDKPAAELARELGVRKNPPYKWKEQLGGMVKLPFHGMDGKQTTRMRRLHG